jgi:hypothetical protein
VRLALVGAVTGLTVVLAGCGGSNGTQSRRAAVNAYFLQVDHAEQPLLGSTGQIDQTFHQYSLARITAAEVRQLAFAQRAIGATLGKLRAITPPPAARPRSGRHSPRSPPPAGRSATTSRRPRRRR